MILPAPVIRCRVPAKFPIVLIGMLATLLQSFAADSQTPTIPADRDENAEVQQVPENWSLHVQSTWVEQGYPRFHSAFSGPNSLDPHTQNKQTFTLTPFIGRRLWQGAEAYFNPEVFKGFGLSKTLGIAGFSNGEAAKAGSYKFNTGNARTFLRQTIGLGGESEWVEGDQNQLAGYRDKDRITVTLGRFATPDIFDNNTYSHDPRTQFMNWALYDAGAWDYAADIRGYGKGGAVELYMGPWALRYGAMLMPEIPNGKRLPAHGFNSLQQNVEEEYDFKLGDRPGAIRVLEFYSRAPMGNFDEALIGSGNVNANIAATRHFGNPKWGFVINGEQELIDDLGAFARISYNDGKTEEFAFTDIDRSVSAGLSLKGRRWDRPDDVVGLAGAVNAISAEHRRFFAAGGLGILVGDGALPNYAPEMIVEAYYSLKPMDYASMTFDYQFVNNPAYNEDRGPVHIFGLRLHFQY